MGNNDLMMMFFSFGIGCFVMFVIMYSYQLFKDKQKEIEEVSEVKQEVKVEEPPRPTKRNTLMAVILINNRTDKEYVVESINDFGLTWTFTSEKEVKNQLLIINQYYSLDKDGRGSNWRGVSRFLDFSVKSTVWKEFDIVYEYENKSEELK